MRAAVGGGRPRHQGRVPGGLTTAPARAAWLAAALVLLVTAPAGAQAPVRYDVSFDHRVHHEVRVRAVFPEVEGTLDVVVASASPGRYALHGFAKNVYGVLAEAGDGTPLDVERVGPARWRVTGHDGTVRFAYTVFGDHADGTFPGIDDTHAHLNMPAVFAFAPALADRPIRVRFRAPQGSGWNVATQLVPTDDPYVFTAPDLDYFMDSPTELSAFQETSWTVDGGSRTFRMAVHHKGSAAEVERFAELARPVLAEQAAIYGGWPAFDHGTYTFIVDYLPWVWGDGMEHRNSTILSGRRPLAGEGAVRNLGTLAHEFFHAWNMERLRAASLEPFDYTGANVSSLLWFGEGFTSYYDGLTMVRAGVLDADDWAADLGRLLNATINAPGRRLRGPAAMSRLAVFVDEAAWVDATNQPNTFLSYYTYGAALAAGLDLTLRTRYDTSLDAVMRSAWERFGEPEVPYTAADLQAVLADVSGDTAFAAAFFHRSIEGSALPDYGPLLAEAGFVLRHAHPDAAVLGAAVEADEAGARVMGPVLVGSPAYHAGLGPGDLLESVDGRPIRGPDDLARALERRDPGDVVELHFQRRGRDVAARVALASDPSLEVVTAERAGRALSPEARALRHDWLGSKARAAPEDDAPGARP